MFRANKRLTELGFALLFAVASFASTARSRQADRFTHTFDAEWAANSTASYADLVHEAQAGHLPSSLDFTQLRVKYAESPDYDPQAGSAETSEMFQKLDAKDYEGALQIANDVIAKQFANIDAHIVARKAYAGLRVHSGDEKLQYLIIRSLVTSVYASAGDGKNPRCRSEEAYGPCGTSIATALKLISVQEEDGLARAKGFQLVKRFSVKSGGRIYDVVSFVNTNYRNSPVTLYFDVTIPAASEKSLPL